MPKDKPAVLHKPLAHTLRQAARQEQRRALGAVEVDMELYSLHKSSVRYQAVMTRAPVQTTYLDRSAMKDPSRPPKRVRITVEMFD